MQHYPSHIITFMKIASWDLTIYWEINHTIIYTHIIAYNLFCLFHKIEFAQYFLIWHFRIGTFVYPTSHYPIRTLFTFLFAYVLPIRTYKFLILYDIFSRTRTQICLTFIFRLLPKRTFSFLIIIFQRSYQK